MNYKLLLVVFLFPFLCNGQVKSHVISNGECGTDFTNEQRQQHYQKVAAYSQKTTAYGNATLAHDTCIRKNLSLIFHIVLDSSGNPGVTPTQIAACVQLLNNVWRPICIKFLNCSTNFIPNWNYNKWYQPYSEPTALGNYFVPNCINIFVVDSIKIPAGASGYASTFSHIVIEKSVLVSTTAIHEMGHVFGLPHTWPPAGEVVKRTNCYSTGDGFCDTDADCYPTGFSMLNPNCTFLPGPTDGAGDYYIPPLDNYMTYFKNCRCRFTQEQYNFMALEFITGGTFLH